MGGLADVGRYLGLDRLFQRSPIRLLTKDGDFTAIAGCSPLRLVTA